MKAQLVEEHTKETFVAVLNSLLSEGYQPYGEMNFTGNAYQLLVVKFDPTASSFAPNNEIDETIAKLSKALFEIVGPFAGRVFKK